MSFYYMYRWLLIRVNINIGILKYWVDGQARRGVHLEMPPPI